jgi:hypothetical protein
MLLRRYNITNGNYSWDVVFARARGYLLSKLALSSDGIYSFLAAGYSAKSIFFKFQNSDGIVIGDL